MVTAKDVLEKVEQLSGYTDLAIKSKKGDRAIWRGMYCLLCREMTNESLRIISKLIDRDHSTVAYWQKKFEHEFYTRPDLRGIYEQAKEELEVLNEHFIDANKLDMEAEKVIRSMRSREKELI